jgi:hypothetical protein
MQELQQIIHIVHVKLLSSLDHFVILGEEWGLKIGNKQELWVPNIACIIRFGMLVSLAVLAQTIALV